MVFNLFGSFAKMGVGIDGDDVRVAMPEMCLGTVHKAICVLKKFATCMYMYAITCIRLALPTYVPCYHIIEEGELPNTCM